MQDRRKSQRWPTYLRGTIAFNKKRSTADCLVRNMSEDGVRLVVPNTTFLPDEFELHLPLKGASYRVRLTWRQYDDMGAQIEEIIREEVPVKASESRRMKRLEQENASLRQRLTGNN